MTSEAETREGAEGRSGFVVRGRVQGVGFRWWTRRVADRLGVAGTVRNRADGTVEVMAVGAVEALVAFESELRAGPPMARVDEVEVVECGLSGRVSDFEIVG